MKPLRINPAPRVGACLLPPVFALAAVLQAAAATELDPALIPVGADWRLLAATNAPSDPLTAWRAPAFDDSAWSVGAAGFSLGGDELTLLPAGNSATVYFRTSFRLDDPTALRWVVLRVDYADGFAAYLNSQPVARRALPGAEPLPFGALADYHSRGATEEINLSEFAPLLVAGTNTLAIELHPYANPPWRYVLVPELRANFQRGPIVRNVTTNGAEIAWRTPVAALGAVEYGVTAALGSELIELAPSTNHAVRLSGLPPDTLCYYRVRCDGDGPPVFSPTVSFRTARAEGNLTFGVLGDSGSGKLPQFQIAACLATSRVDLVLHVGDVVYPQFTTPQADTRCHSIYEPHQRSTPYYFVFGNHDLYSGSDAAFLDSFAPPTNSATGTGHYYSFDQGDAHFACLFVPLLSYPGATSAYALTPGSTQWNWLVSDLAASAKPWKFLVLHCPLFTSSLHRGDDYNFNGVPDRVELQQWLLPLAARYGVQAVFTGHDHTYERFAPVNGVHCFVSGGGGYTLYGLYQPDAQSLFFASRFHHLRATVQGETTVVEAIDQFGVGFDQVMIPRTSIALRLDQTGPHALRLTWSSRPGMLYGVEAAGTLAGPFAPVQAPTLPRLATDLEEHFDLETPPAGPPQRFFRVRTLPPQPIN